VALIPRRKVRRFKALLVTNIVWSSRKAQVPISISSQSV
jgi:hypothetical protein